MSDFTKNETIQMEVPAGENIFYTSQTALKIAHEKNVMVEFEFNGTKVYACPTMTVNHVGEIYTMRRELARTEKIRSQL